MINHHLSVLVDQLCAEGIADPLAQSFTLAALWDDPAAIVGESPPADVRAVLGGEPCPGHGGARGVAIGSLRGRWLVGAGGDGARPRAGARADM